MGLKERVASKLTNWLMKDDPPLEFSMCDFERIKYEVRPCDVLLIEGRNRVSHVIKTITQSRWSHAAIYIGRQHDVMDGKQREQLNSHYFGDPNDQLVIESYLGQGTIVSSLDNYKDDHIRICRPKGLSGQDSQQVINYAIGRLGLDYDVRQIFDLARYLFPWSITPRNWRSSLFQYNAGKATRQICSTLIAEAFTTVKFPILPLIKKHKQQIQFIHRNPRLCTPSDFDYSPYFEIIKYPLFEVSGHAVYRGLPWDEEAVSNDKQGIVRQDDQTEVAADPKTDEEHITTFDFDEKASQAAANEQMANGQLGK